MRMAHNPYTNTPITITAEKMHAPRGTVYRLEGVRFMMFTEICDALGFEPWELSVLAGRTADIIELMLVF